jgi:hypothetical protein
MSSHLNAGSKNPTDRATVVRIITVGCHSVVRRCMPWRIAASPDGGRTVASSRPSGLYS